MSCQPELCKLLATPRTLIRAATPRNPGHVEPDDASAPTPTMVTLLLPVGRTDVASGRECPHLRLLSERPHGNGEPPSHPHSFAGAPSPCCFGHRRLAELREGAASDCEPHDPWAGSTAYVRVRGLSWFYPHPFTVAGSVALGAMDAAATGCTLATLKHAALVAPQRR